MITLSNYRLGYIIEGSFRFFLFPPPQPTAYCFFKKADGTWRSARIHIGSSGSFDLEKYHDIFLSKIPKFSLDLSSLINRKFVLDLTKNFPEECSVALYLKGRTNNNFFTIKIFPFEPGKYEAKINEKTALLDFGPLSHLPPEQLRRLVPEFDRRFAITCADLDQKPRIKITQKQNSISLQFEEKEREEKKMPDLFESDEKKRWSPEINNRSIPVSPMLTLQTLGEGISQSRVIQQETLTALRAKQLILLFNGNKATETEGGFLFRVANKVIDLMTADNFDFAIDQIDCLLSGIHTNDLIRILSKLAEIGRNDLSLDSASFFQLIKKIINNCHQLIYVRSSSSNPEVALQISTAMYANQLNNYLEIFRTLTQEAERMSAGEKSDWLCNLVRSSLQITDLLTLESSGTNGSQNIRRQFFLGISEKSRSTVLLKYLHSYAQIMYREGQNRIFPVSRALANLQGGVPLNRPWLWTESMTDSSKEHIAKELGIDPNQIERNWLFAVLGVRQLLFCETSMKFTNWLAGLDQYPDQILKSMAINHPFFLIGCLEFCDELLASSSTSRIIRQRVTALIEAFSTNRFIRENLLFLESRDVSKEIYEEIEEWLKSTVSELIHSNSNVEPPTGSYKIFERAIHETAPLIDLFHQIEKKLNKHPQFANESDNYLPLNNEQHHLNDAFEDFLKGDTPTMLFQGTTGSGKTLSIRMLMYDLLANQGAGSYFPLMANFRKKTNQLDDPFTYAINANALDLPGIEQFLQNSRILWIFDDFEDIEYFKDQTILKRFFESASRFPNSKFIFLLRELYTASNQFRSTKHAIIYLNCLNKEELKTFVRAFVKSEKAIAQSQTILNEVTTEQQVNQYILFFNGLGLEEWIETLTNPRFLKIIITAIPKLVKKLFDQDFNTINFKLLKEEQFLIAGRLLITIISHVAAWRASFLSDNKISPDELLQNTAKLAYEMHLNDPRHSRLGIGGYYCEYKVFFQKKVLFDLLHYYDEQFSFISDQLKDYFISLEQDPEPITFLEEIVREIVTLDNFPLIEYE